LEESGAFANFSEVFHTAPYRNARSFVNFAAERCVQVADMATSEQAAAVADAYLAWLADAAGARIPLIDVKHDQWNALRPFWGYPSDAPFFLDHLKRRGATFLAITRRDLAGQVMSEAIARACEKWHELTPAEAPPPFAMNVDAARDRARRILEAEALLAESLGEYPNVIFAPYETLFYGDAVAPWLANALEAAFETPLPAPPKVRLKKNAVEKAAVVANAHEVTEAVEALVEAYGRPLAGL
jgi:hypothetical protein